MSWSKPGRLIGLAMLAVGAALVLAVRRPEEVWHTLADQNSGTGP